MAKKFFILFLAAAVLICPGDLRAGSIGDFFKALGNSLAHPGGGKKKSQSSPTKKSKTKSVATQPGDPPPSPNPVSSEMPSPNPSASQVPVRVASIPAQHTRRDLPYAIPVPNKPGFVTSPYAPKAGYVDVRGFPSGTEVKDPYSGKVFLTP